MKKSLLFAAAMCFAATSFASVLDLQPDGDDVKRKIDPTAYAAYTTADGKTFELTNRWILSWQADGAEVLNTYFISTSGYNATSVALNGILYVADGALADQAGIDKYDLVSGKYLGTIKLSVDGTPLAAGIGSILNVTKDDFGHLIFHGYAASVGLNATTGSASGITVYYVEDLETGACKQAAFLTLPDVEQDRTACRVDYSSVTGDITGTEAHCYVMAVPTNNETLCYRWKLEQGATEWVGDFPDMNGDGVGDVVWTVENLNTYPAGQTLWNTGSYLRIVKDDSYSASLFYIDGNTTLPVLYDTNGNMIDGCAIFDSAQGEVVANIPGEWMPDGSVNGLVEFSIAGKNFVAFATGQHNKFPNDGIRIIEVGENFEWSQDLGAALAWQQVPTAGFGTNVGGGRRITSLDVDVVNDETNGKEGVYLSINRLGNGLAVYSIAEQGWVDPYGAGIGDIVVDEVEGPATYYNLQGVKVANPENGLYIVKRGNKVAKELVK